MEETQVPLTALNVLAVLATAGTDGLAAGTLAGQFAMRPAWDGKRLRRSVAVNGILERHAIAGRVRRSDVKEPSPRYHNTPCWRWFITDGGLAYLASGGQVAAGQRRTEAREARERERAQAAERRELAGRAARVKVAAARTWSTAARDDALRELRAQGATLADLARAAGITRERVRQIVTPGYARSPVKNS